MRISDWSSDVCSSDLLRYDFRPGHGSAVDGHLVGAREQQGAGVLNRAHAAAYGKRHETHLCGAPDYIEDGPTRLMTGGNVKEAQLVRPRRVIEARLLHRIARIGEIDEIDAFHHAPIGEGEAGNDSGENCPISTPTAYTCTGADGS